MSMTAAELHALYAPLWQAVPRTRPDGLEFDPDDDQADGVFLMRCIPLMEVGIRDLLMGAMRADPEMVWAPMGIVSFDTAATLCRVAAEDWARSVGGSVEIENEKGNRIWVRIGGGMGKGFESIMPGQRCAGDEAMAVHYALVEACLAVARAKVNA